MIYMLAKFRRGITLSEIYSINFICEKSIQCLSSTSAQGFDALQSCSPEESYEIFDAIIQVKFLFYYIIKYSYNQRLAIENWIKSIRISY